VGKHDGRILAGYIFWYPTIFDIIIVSSPVEVFQTYYIVCSECSGVNEFCTIPTRNRVTRNSNICAQLKSKSNQITNQII